MCESRLPSYGKAQAEQAHPNIIKFGRSRQGRQRYRCKTCGQAFCETTGTLFANRKTPEATILECLAMIAEGMRISSVSRVKGIKEDTLLDWIRSAGDHAEAVEAVLLAEYVVSRGQSDGLWLYVGNKGEKNYPQTASSGQFWRSTMIEMDTRLRVARGIDKSKTAASTLVLETLKARGHPILPPPTVSDGWGGICEALVAVYDHVPEYQGIGRPTTRKQPVPGWQYLQVVKQRDDHGNLIDIDLRVIFGDEDEVLALLGASTAYIERTHLTLRHFNSRLTAI